MSEPSEEKKACPLSSVPPEVWQAVLETLRPKPFPKRHPILTLILIGILIFVVIAIVTPSQKSNEGEPEISDDSLALIRIKGVILDTQEQLKWIRTLEQNAKIKGVLLRVDSPGGGASASQELYAALKRLAEKKPLAVSMGSVAASGGLMVSMAGKKIFANASTITGSIGVRMDIPQVKELLDKVGVHQETLVTGPYKDAGSSLRPLSDEDRRYLLGILTDLHTQFVEIIAGARGMPEEQVKNLATGRVYTGREAKGLGLVDELGGQEDAHDWLAKETGVSREKKLITKPKRFTWYEELLTSELFGHLFEAISPSPHIARYQW